MKRRVFLTSAVAAAAIAVPNVARADSRMRILSLARDGTSARVPFTRDGSFVYLPGFDSLCWLLRDMQAPPEIGYVSMSIDLIETLYEVQQRVGGDALVVRRGFCRNHPAGESSDLGEQHMGGLAVDLVISQSDARVLVRSGLVRQSDVFRDHVHVAALEDRWQRSRIPN